MSNIKRSQFYLIFIVLTFLIYGNAINNEYSLDDNIVVDGVEKVEKGIGGIKEIFTTHYAQDKEQSYGYRPIVLLTYAIEKELFSGLPAYQTPKEKEKKDRLTQANVSHFVNVCLYALTCLLLFNFLTQVLTENNVLISFLIVLLFLVHPLHTEPVANIKSRDELLVFIGVLLSLMSYVKFAEIGKLKHLLVGVLFTVLSLLSKKSGMAIFGLIPVVLYFKKIHYKKLVMISFSVIIPIALLLLLKKGLVSESANRDVLFHENPMVLASDFMSRITLASVSALFYLKMLFFPYNLSFYYGFNQIEMPSWNDFNVWISIVIYIPLGVYGVLRFIKRDLLGLGIVWWFGVMLGVVNLFFPIVGIVADRFTYIFSLGFCIVIIALLVKFFKIKVNKDDVRIKLPFNFLILFSILILLSSFRVIKRNSNWEDYLTLFRSDINHLDKSAKANSLLGDYLYKELDKEKNPQKANDIFLEMERHYLQALSIYPAYFTPYNNLGTAYFTYKGDMRTANKYFSEALVCDSTSLVTRYNLARTHELLKDYDVAEEIYLRTIKEGLLSKNDTDVAMRSYSYYGMMVVKQNDIKKAFQIYKNAVKDFPEVPEFNFYLANLYLADQDTLTSLIYYNKSLELKPDNTRLSSLIQKLEKEILK